MTSGRHVDRSAELLGPRYDVTQPATWYTGDAVQKVRGDGQQLRGPFGDMCSTRSGSGRSSSAILARRAERPISPSDTNEMLSDFGRPLPAGQLATLLPALRCHHRRCAASSGGTPVARPAAAAVRALGDAPAGRRAARVGGSVAGSSLLTAPGREREREEERGNGGAVIVGAPVREVAGESSRWIKPCPAGPAGATP